MADKEERRFTVALMGSDHEARSQLAQSIKSAGHDVSEAPTPEEAIDLLCGDRARIASHATGHCLGEIEPGPRFLSNFATTAEWLEEFRDRWDTNTRIFLPEFGKPIVLYPPPAPEA